MKDRRIKPDTVAREVLAAVNQGHKTFSKIQLETGRTAGRISDALGSCTARTLLASTTATAQVAICQRRDSSHGEKIRTAHNASSRPPFHSRS